MQEADQKGKVLDKSCTCPQGPDAVDWAFVFTTRSHVADTDLNTLIQGVDELVGLTELAQMAGVAPS